MQFNRISYNVICVAAMVYLTIKSLSTYFNDSLIIVSKGRFNFMNNKSTTKLFNS